MSETQKDHAGFKATVLILLVFIAMCLAIAALEAGTRLSEQYEQQVRYGTVKHEPFTDYDENLWLYEHPKGPVE